MNNKEVRDLVEKIVHKLIIKKEYKDIVLYWINKSLKEKNESHTNLGSRKWTS